MSPIPTFTVPPSGLPHAEYARFESMRQFEAMLDELIAQTQRIIRVFDRSLSAVWNTTARCDLVRDFLRADPLNRLYLVVHQAEGLDRVCPRFMAVLQRYGHVARLRQTPRAARHLYDPFVVFDGSHYLHRFHYDHMRYARGMNDVDGARELVDRYTELWEVSKPVSTGGPVGL
ncbi:MAG TPA: hypothetical protein VHP37_04035 [Burkholderiales bacterium]|nr:hypothetical protein [Burkholderiales bacterium]